MLIERLEQDGWNVKKLKENNHSWHTSMGKDVTGIEISKNDEYYFSLCDVRSGCGTCIIYDINVTNLSSFKEVFLQVCKRLKNDGVGAIFHTLGQHKKNLRNCIINAGFEPVAKYNNYRHGEEYYQELFICKLNHEGIPERLYGTQNHILY